MSTAVIVLAGGSGSRLRHHTNKVFAPIGGLPLIAWSLRAAAGSTAATSLVLVARAHEEDRVAALAADHCGALPWRVATGGDTRHDSECAGLEAIAAEIARGDIDVVLIHDAARPFAGRALIDRIAGAAATVGGAVPVVPLGADVHRVDDDGHVHPPPPDLYRVQTPQGFRARELLGAYRHTGADGFSAVDTSQTVRRRTTLDVAALPGSSDNIKVTFPDDLTVAAGIATAHEPAALQLPAAHEPPVALRPPGTASAQRPDTAVGDAPAHAAGATDLARAVRTLSPGAPALAWPEGALPPERWRRAVAVLSAHMAGCDAALFAESMPDAVKHVVDGRVRGTVSRDGLCVPVPPLLIRPGAADDALLAQLDAGRDPVAALLASGHDVRVVPVRALTGA